MNNPPTPSSVRVTVPVSPEVLGIFQRLAKAGSMSTGRAMGEWLGDTVEAAELMATTMERARAAPKVVTAELHAMMLGMTDQTKELMDKFSKMGKAAKAGSGKRSALTDFAGTSAAETPPSNTGVNYPKSTRTQKGKS